MTCTDCERRIELSEAVIFTDRTMTRARCGDCHLHRVVEAA